MLRQKNEGLSISFLGVIFPTPPLLIPHFYHVTIFWSDFLPSQEKIRLYITLVLKSLYINTIFRRLAWKFCVLKLINFLLVLSNYHSVTKL